MDKILIYQMLPRLWGNKNKKCVKSGSLEQNGCGKFSDINEKDLLYLKNLGMSYVWYTGMIRHSTVESTNGCSASHPQFVKGRAGSPYAICDYYDVNPYLADDPQNRMEEFEDLIKRTHKAGLKVLIDFVPNHVSRDYGRLHSPYTPCGVVGLGQEDDKGVHWKPENDFFYYPFEKLHMPNDEKFLSENPGASLYEEFPAKASGNTYTSAPGINDWYETIKINYCDFHTVTWEKMRDIILFWASKGVDGFRCDMVELVPYQFFKWLIPTVKEQYPDIIFLAEVYDKNLYRRYAQEVGFDLLYDKSGLYDVLLGIAGGFRSTKEITWNWQFLGDDLPSHMLNFLENHDEPRFPTSDFGKDKNKTFAYLYTSLFFNKTPFMVYFGEEIGEPGNEDEGFSGKNNRTTIFDWWSMESIRKIHSHRIPKEDKPYYERFTSALKTASSDPAILYGDTFDLCYCNKTSPGFDPDKSFAFLRSYGKEVRLIAANFSDYPTRMCIRIPEEAYKALGLSSKVSNWIELEIGPSDAILKTL